MIVVWGIPNTRVAKPIRRINNLPSRAGLSYCGRGEFAPTHTYGGNNMKNPLDSLWGTVISGLVLTLILYWVVKLALGS